MALYDCPADTKRTAYLTLVRSIMEYAAPIWDPYYDVDIYMLEKVQRRAARWILSEYSRTSSVTALLSNLEIPTLEQRRQSSRLTLFNLTFYPSQFHPITITLNLLQDNITETTLSYRKPH